MTRNQTAVIGPKNFATVPVPCDWIAKRPMRMQTEIGIIKSSIAGVTSFRPSTAESTDSAGVIMASPRNRAAPMRPSTMRTLR